MCRGWHKAYWYCIDASWRNSALLVRDTICQSCKMTATIEQIVLTKSFKDLLLNEPHLFKGHGHPSAAPSALLLILASNSLARVGVGIPRCPPAPFQSAPAVLKNWLQDILKTKHVKESNIVHVTSCWSPKNMLNMWLSGMYALWALLAFRLLASRSSRIFLIVQGFTCVSCQLCQQGQSFTSHFDDCSQKMLLSLLNQSALAPSSGARCNNMPHCRLHSCDVQPPIWLEQ